MPAFGFTLRSFLVLGSFRCTEGRDLEGPLCDPPPAALGAVTQIVAYVVRAFVRACPGSHCGRSCYRAPGSAPSLSHLKSVYTAPLPETETAALATAECQALYHQSATEDPHAVDIMLFHCCGSAFPIIAQFHPD